MEPSTCIQNYRDKPWNWVGLSYNTNITFDIIENCIDKPWSWEWLSRNTMTKCKNEYVEKQISKIRIEF